MISLKMNMLVFPTCNKKYSEALDLDTFCIAGQDFQDIINVKTIGMGVVDEDIRVW